MRSAIVARIRQVLIAGREHLTQRPKVSSWQKLLHLAWSGLAGVVLVILGLVVWRSKENLLVVLRTARCEYFVLTFVAYTVSIGTVALGWHLVMRHLGGQERLLLNLKAYVYTLAARRLPGALWYVAGRVVLYRRLGVPGRVSVLACGIEVVLSVVSGLMVGAPALLFQMGTSLASTVIFVLVELIGLCLLYPKNLRWLLARFGHHVEPGCLTVPRVTSWLGAYTAMWISGGLMTYTVVSALYPLSLSQVPWTISLWALTGAVSFITFLLPNNLGASEIALSVLLSRIVPLYVAIATAVLLRVLTTIVDIMWSFLFLWEKSRHVSPMGQI
jgi:hypothetical protein